MFYNVFQMVNPAGMESPLVDRPFEPGEALKARVIGISAARRHCRGSDQRKTLEFSLTGCDKVCSILFEMAVT